MSELAIWWTSQDDYEAIGDALPESLPEYIREEYRSRIGRNGRGRLWLADEIDTFPDEGIDPWPETPLAGRLALDYGGIVIRAEDAPLLADFPGVITDLAVRHFGLFR